MNKWNSLPQEVVVATSTDNFKKGLHKRMAQMSFSGY